MKRALIILLALLLFTGCAKQREEPPANALAPAKETGKVPEELQEAIENDLFTIGKRYSLKDAYPAEDRVVMTELTTDGTHMVLRDAYGNQLAGHTEPFIEDMRVCQALATADGGFIYVVGFTDHALEEGGWASDGGFASRVIKCDEAGRIEWESILEGYEAGAFRRAVERGGAYYFFGDYYEQMHSTPTDVIMLMLDGEGNVTRKKALGGSDYDSLERVVPTDSGFTVYISSQSRDGDLFPVQGEEKPYYPKDFAIEIDNKFNKKKATLCDDLKLLYVEPIGVLKGREVYADDAVFENVPGTAAIVFDYGDKYLVVSENFSGKYKNTPGILSVQWYYTETVYSVFDPDGALICRRTFDSSPDFEGMAKQYE